MNLKKIFSSLFSYKPKEEYEFNLSTYPEENIKSDSYISEEKIDKVKNIFPSIKVNLEYMKSKYNVLINSDIVLREFVINARGKQYNAFIFYIDGMVDSSIMDDFVIQPLMLRNKNNLYDGKQTKVISEAVTNNITVRKVKKFDLATYIMSSLMPQNSVKKISEFSKVFSGINSRELCTFY